MQPNLGIGINLITQLSLAPPDNLLQPAGHAGFRSESGKLLVQLIAIRSTVKLTFMNHLTRFESMAGGGDF